MSKLAESDQRLEIAPNPYVDFGKKLSRDEFYAGTLSAIVTGLANVVLGLTCAGVCNPALKSTVLAVAGPLFEKPGLFFHYFKEAYKEYRRTPKNDRKSLGDYISSAFKKGWPSLRTDIMFHDSSYAVFMWLSIYLFHPDGSILAAVLSIFCFLAALACATAMQVKYTDFKYWLLGQRLKARGFGREVYYEVRFLVSSAKNEKPISIIADLAGKFHLKDRRILKYADHYFVYSSLPEYNSRRPYVRLRERTTGKGHGVMKSIQVAYTKASEFGQNKISMFRCFPVEKHKYYFMLPANKEMPKRIKEIADLKVKKLLMRWQKSNALHRVTFQRLVARDPNGLLVSADMPARDTGYFWIEIKAYRDLHLLKRVSDYVLSHYHVIGTTENKMQVSRNHGKHGRTN